MPSVQYPQFLTAVPSTQEFNSLIDYPINSIKEYCFTYQQKGNDYCKDHLAKLLYTHRGIRRRLTTDNLLTLYTCFNNIECHLENGTRSLRYDKHSKILYSYGEPISYKSLINGREKIFFYRKSKKLGGEYFSNTTSKLLHWAIEKANGEGIPYKILDLPTEQTFDDCVIETDKKDCSICLCNDDDGHYIETSCGHSFHKECLKHWWNSSDRKCPLCRTNLFQGDAPSIVIEPLPLMEDLEQL